MLRLRRKKGTRNWSAYGSILGKRFPERSTKTHDKRAAEAIKVQWEAERTKRYLSGGKAAMSFAEAATIYIKAGHESRFLGPLVDYFGVTRIDRIDQAEAKNASIDLYPNGSKATRNRQVFTPLSAVLKFAGQNVAFTRPKVVTAERPAATPEQVAAFVAAADRHLGALAIFMAYTGRRISECCRLTWDDVDLESREALIRQTKNGEPFTAYLPDSAFLALANLPGREGKVFGFKSRHYVYVSWRKACKDAKIPYLRPHEMGRHTFATWLRRYSGQDLKAIMEAGGWKSVASVIRYIKVSKEEVQKAADDLPNVSIMTGKR